MKLNSISIGLMIALGYLLFSCSEKPQSPDVHQTTMHVEDEPYHKTLFVNDLNFLKHEFPQECEWAQKERKGKLIELEKDTGSQDFLEYTYSLAPLPGLGEFYAVNLTGDEKPEYISFMYFSPLLSWTNYAIVYNDQVEPLDTLEIDSKEGLCSINFKKLQSADKYNIVAEWEQSISVYQDAGINIYELKDGKLDEIFLTNTFFESREKAPDYNSYDQWTIIKTIKREIVYQDVDNNGVKELEVETIETGHYTDVSPRIKARPISYPDTILHQIFIHKWDPKLNDFDKTQVIGLEDNSSDSTSVL